ncbi:PPE-repeat protein [Serpentinimonas maccroryi]|uniref:PPE-repeat protein n=1 Tax=Serpentinimonas maccroryi TaxID=1458426 RepID=A0A060NKE3_9BURK|nr:hypothetical protein [Serpentinimonas maccroryi]BAO82916.1 PPE-repeat protein [Serpentinimonas maccroryi]
MQTRSIELLKPHTHAGKRLAVGARIDLPDDSARWLIDLDVAKAATAPVTPAPDSKPARRDAASGTTQPKGD